MRLVIDGEADAAYLCLADSIADGEAVSQIAVNAPDLNGTIVVDLDENGRILGFEIIGARALLPRSAQ
ncbi:DUF2283 domain-containing protein [Herbidospora sp. NEAU-GS84]|uniref:DUF2283 domain-containing protein n=1 Tax=Herbidospora solisilvae TaxID=2696284 RepID=A0A7C9J1H7_9ACTN|nr:DUF2283 domain-containing protein [Herbidospora solisilvae]NAS21826.1 DUF2283 domain-containing protein [Herbidospora solisilvae]